MPKINYPGKVLAGRLALGVLGALLPSVVALIVERAARYSWHTLTNAAQMILLPSLLALAVMTLLLLLLVLAVMAISRLCMPLRMSRKLDTERRCYGGPCPHRFLVVLGVLGAAVICLWITSRAVVSAALSGFLQNNNFVVSLLLVLIPLLSTLRPSVLRRQTWKMLADEWAKWSGVSALSVGGLGFIGLMPKQRAVLLPLAVLRSQLPEGTLVGLYIAFVLIAGMASLLRLVGRASAITEDSWQPIGWFVPSFALYWIANLGMFTLFTNGVILTLMAHVAASIPVAR